MKNNELLEHLSDCETRSRNRNMHVESYFLNEEEQALAKTDFPESMFIHYEGGYEGSRKKKVIFLSDEEDGFYDIVCIGAKVDQRFRSISHRDILGSLMALSIDRHSFGDFWMDDNHIYLYTTTTMARFLCDEWVRIANLNVHFEILKECPVQIFRTKPVKVVVSSLRLDTLSAALAHTSRTKAVEMIHKGMVSKNHVPLDDPSELCDNGCTISIRKCGRFHMNGVLYTTKKDRIAVEFLQDI